MTDQSEIEAVIEALVAQPVNCAPGITQEDARRSRRSTLRSIVDWPLAIRALDEYRDDMTAFSASDAACYAYPGDDQQQLRQAFVNGAVSAHRAACEPGWRPTHRHVKRGTEYEVIGNASVQAGSLIHENDILVVYRGHDGKLWARPAHEFNDGRFESLPTPPEPEA